MPKILKNDIKMANANLAVVKYVFIVNLLFYILGKCTGCVHLNIEGDEPNVVLCNVP